MLLPAADSGVLANSLITKADMTVWEALQIEGVAAFTLSYSCVKLMNYSFIL